MSINGYYDYYRMAAWVLGNLNTPVGEDTEGLEGKGFDLSSLPESSLIRSFLSYLLVPKGIHHYYYNIINDCINDYYEKINQENHWRQY